MWIRVDMLRDSEIRAVRGFRRLLRPCREGLYRRKARRGRGGLGRQLVF